MIIIINSANNNFNNIIIIPRSCRLPVTLYLWHIPLARMYLYCTMNYCSSQPYHGLPEISYSSSTNFKLADRNFVVVALRQEYAASQF